MTFTTITNMTNYIKAHHYLFADVPWQDEWHTILGNLNHQIMTTACVGATFEAWQDVPDYGDLKTYIYIEKHSDGYWIYYESADLEKLMAIIDANHYTKAA